MINHNISLIEKWAEDRNLIEGSTPQAQMLKTVEELGELAGAIAKNNREVQIDSIGDVVVTLVILSRQLDIDFGEAVRVAYNDIKDRKGQMINGIFVKESDL